jgi:hypothetical protein
MWAVYGILRINKQTSEREREREERVSKNKEEKE